jgi:hypothetical protein
MPCLVSSHHNLRRLGCISPHVAAGSRLPLHRLSNANGTRPHSMVSYITPANSARPTQQHDWEGRVRCPPPRTHGACAAPPLAPAVYFRARGANTFFFAGPMSSRGQPPPRLFVYLQEGPCGPRARPQALTQLILTTSSYGVLNLRSISSGDLTCFGICE